MRCIRLRANGVVLSVILSLLGDDKCCRTRESLCINDLDRRI